MIPAAGSMEADFKTPPAEARPWVYWFWLNGNITREGITADLEAMARVGIGGVLIMEVDQGAPLGPVPFMSDQWRELFKHVHSEAKRLGLEVNMNNDAGWNGSGGPWIRPEQSMQKVVWTETEVEGGKRFDGVLPEPKAVAGFYNDISVLAFPTTGAYRIPGIEQKAGYWGGPNSPGSGGAATDSPSPDAIIGQDRIVYLTTKMDSTGRLVWDVPPGKWTVIRFGHTSTGAQNGPAHDSGRGLECDKLSRKGVEANFKGMMAKLAKDTGITPTSGSSTSTSMSTSRSGLVATHVDSWEVGSQNWTALMREEFRKRRGYEMLPFLPAMTGRVVGSLEISERFLWDLRRTISELVVENYAGHLRDLAHRSGMRFTIEAYGSPCDNIPYAGMADEPMGEFWTPSGAMETCKAMASAGHVYGKPIIGAEAFTAADHEKWLYHPAAVKALGDQAFCNGINRFVFHRYAMQPWVTPERVPGMTMGPWGLHYERTNTWWEQSGPWHEYLARCQYMLRQGLFVADICYVQNEAPPQTFRGLERNGYEWDEASAEVVLDRMSVKDGLLTLPDGMSYRILALSDSRAMTPQLLTKIKQLVEAGATIVGRPPERSPSLSNYPKCDEDVKRLAAELWGESVAGKQIGYRRVGKGRVVWGVAPERVLVTGSVRQDFSSTEQLRYIHRTTGDTDIYFVSNPHPFAVTTTAAFRVSGKNPELWWPDTGRIERAAVCREMVGMTDVLLPLGPSGSVFVVFRKGERSRNTVARVELNGNQVISAIPEPPPVITLRKAVYGVLDDPARTRDVIAKVQAKIDAGEYGFRVSDMAAGDDPAYGIVKTLIIEYTAEGKDFTARGTDPESISLSAGPKAAPVCELRRDGDGLTLTAWERGKFTVTGSDGRRSDVSVPALPKRIEIGGPWEVHFPDQQVVFDRLTSWTEHSDPIIKYFSGTAIYDTTFDAPDYLLMEGHVVRLELGDVQVIAQVRLNGKALGMLWKPPFSVDISDVLRRGRNELEITVTNLLVNRMIGDEQLPEDSDRNPNGTLKSWPEWLNEGKPSPTGRFTFTSWRMWRKDDPLLPSGLLGPVTLRVGYETTVN